MRNFQLFFCLLVFFLAKVITEDFQKIYIKSVRCNCSERYVFRNYSCFAKSYSRTRSTVNIYMLNRDNKTDINLIVSLSYKYGAIYREVMHTPKFDWCALMEARETNPMILQILTVFKESFPELIHKCPFQGIFIRNSTVMTNSMASVFPTGDYIFNVFFHKKDTTDYHTSIKVMMSMLTSNKDTFG